MTPFDEQETFLRFAAENLNEHVGRIRRCVGLLTDEQVWYRANENSNSIGNLLLHLRGNITQWIVSNLGGRAFERDRPAEFAQRVVIAKDVLMRQLEEAVAATTEVIRGGREKLGQRYKIQAYDVSGLEAIFHVVEHFAYHTGQIITTTKWLLDVDLSLYDEQGRRKDGKRTGAP